MLLFLIVIVFFFSKQKTASELRISDWRSDVCSSDLRILRMPWRGSLSPGDKADLVIVADTGQPGPCTLPGLDRSQLRAVVHDGLPCIADPDLADWFALAGIDAVPVTLDGKPKLLARSLADPAVV